MGDKKIERQELSASRREAEALERIADLIEEHVDKYLDRIADLLERFLFPAARGFQILQTIGGINVAITGIVLAATGVFAETLTPVGGALQAGSIPKWSADDPMVSLTPSADGTSCAVATSAADTATSFNLTVSGVNSAGAAISSSVNVPLLPVAAVPATGFSINQTS